MQAKGSKIEVRRHPGAPLGAGALCLSGWLFFAYLAVRVQAWEPLLYGAGVLIFPLLVLIEYLCWKLTLDPRTGTIEYRRLFLRRRYRYSQIREAEVYSSPATKYKEYLYIIFDDGKRICLPEYYRNYSQAYRELLRHTTIIKNTRTHL